MKCSSFFRVFSRLFALWFELFDFDVPCWCFISIYPTCGSLNFLNVQISQIWEFFWGDLLSSISLLCFEIMWTTHTIHYFVHCVLQIFYFHTDYLSACTVSYREWCYYEVKSLSRVWLFVTLWTVAHQAPQSMGFSRQEYWSGLPFPSPGGLDYRDIQICTGDKIVQNFTQTHIQMRANETGKSD